MSLSQRLQRKPDGVSDVEHYETVIRQLKLLSKSQTALLKVTNAFPLLFPARITKLVSYFRRIFTRS
jgi:hypothetical protein